MADGGNSNRTAKERRQKLESGGGSGGGVAAGLQGNLAALVRRGNLNPAASGQQKVVDVANFRQRVARGDETERDGDEGGGGVIGVGHGPSGGPADRNEMKAVGGWHAPGVFTSSVSEDVYFHRDVLYFTSSKGRYVIFWHFTSSIGERFLGLEDVKVSYFCIYIFYSRCS